MDITLIRSNKHKGAIFIKVRRSNDHFLCKIYPQVTTENTERIARAIKKALEFIPATVIKDNIKSEDDGDMSLGEEQAMRQAGAY